MTPTQLTQIHAAIILLCKHFKVTTAQLECSKRFAGGGYHKKDGKAWGMKRPDLNLARQMLSHYCHVIGVSDDQTGLLLNRCRSAVGHARTAFKDRLDTERNVREVWEWLESSI